MIIGWVSWVAGVSRSLFMRLAWNKWSPAKQAETILKAKETRYPRYRDPTFKA